MTNDYMPGGTPEPEYGGYTMAEWLEAADRLSDALDDDYMPGGSSG